MANYFWAELFLCINLNHFKVLFVVLFYYLDIYTQCMTCILVLICFDKKKYILELF